MAARSYSRLYHDVSSRTDLTAAEKTVFAALEHFKRYRGAGGVITPSVAMLALHAGVSPPTVKRAVRKLAACGLVNIDRGNGRRNRYTLTEGTEPRVKAADSGNQTGIKTGIILEPKPVSKRYRSDPKTGIKMIPVHKVEDSYLNKKQQQKGPAVPPAATAPTRPAVKAAADLEMGDKGANDMAKKSKVPSLPEPPDPTTAAKLARETERAEIAKYLTPHVGEPRALAKITAQPGLTLGVCKRVVREWLNSSGKLGIGWLVDTLTRPDVWRQFDAAAGPTGPELERKRLIQEQQRREQQRQAEAQTLAREKQWREAMLRQIPTAQLPDLLSAARLQTPSKPATVPTDWRDKRWWVLLVLRIWREQSPAAYATAAERAGNRDDPPPTPSGQPPSLF